MTTFFTTSETLNGNIWTGGYGAGVYVASGVALVDDANNSSPALSDEYGSAAAQVYGSVASSGDAIAFGNGNADVSGVATIQVGSAGSLTSTLGNAIDIDGYYPGYQYSIANHGELDSIYYAGISTSAAGTITNVGVISGSDGIDYGDSVSTDTTYLYNEGTISGRYYGVLEEGAGIVDIYNSGAINGGTNATDAVLLDPTTTETLTNYATGTVSGGVDLQGTATVVNEGAISGGTTLEGVATLVNSGTMDRVNFTDAASGSSFSNSGVVTAGVTAPGASFVADNSGTIVGPVDLTGDSASLTDSGTIKQGVTLAGSVSGTADVNIASAGVVTSLPGFNGLAIQSGAYDIVNDGEILAGFTGVDLNGGGQLVNHGKIASGPGGAAVYNDAGAGATAFVYNYGSIDAPADGLEDTGGHLAEVFNYGAIVGGPGFSGVFADGSTFENLANHGTIENGVLLLGGSTVRNLGTIDGGVILDGAGASLTDSGTIENGVSFSSAGASLTNAHAGAIIGPVNFDGASDTIDNAGKIDGAVTLLAGHDSFTNAGDIDGAVAFTGTGATNAFTNSGDITGAITLLGAGSTFTNSGDITGAVAQKSGNGVMTNHGQIYGDVTLAGSDTLTNTGTIHGDVKLGASDTIDSSRGAITGAITAANSDTFAYEGLFGIETINKFVAGSGSTHDTIQFAANDFGSFAAVQSAMSQVGSDTLIRLDANDSITLVGVTMSSLVAADFKFG